MWAFPIHFSRQLSYWYIITVLLLTHCNDHDQPLVASFEVDTLYLCQVTFKNNSLAADSYMWDFGDGATSKEMDPSHTFQDSVAHQVTLTAFNGDQEDSVKASVIGCGCIDQFMGEYNFKRTSGLWSSGDIIDPFVRYPAVEMYITNALNQFFTIRLGTEDTKQAQITGKRNFVVLDDGGGGKFFKGDSVEFGWFFSSFTSCCGSIVLVDGRRK